MKIEVGDRHHRLQVICEASKDKHRHRRYVCKCSCGNIKVIIGQNLTNGRTKSCGCLQKEIVSSICKNRITHGMSNTTEYEIWASMKQRCLNNNDAAYKNYGGRGITICQEWIDSFETFYLDMGDRPKGRSIDRKNNNGPYCKENCRWGTRSEQTRNSRRSTVTPLKVKLIRYFNKRGCNTRELASLCSISYTHTRRIITKEQWRDV